MGKSPSVLKSQLSKAVQTNLNPQFINVYVAGRVNAPGEINIPQGSTLNLALTLAGGPKQLRGKVEFVRFTRDGKVERRIFPYTPSADEGTLSNPILAAGDLIRVQSSLLGKTTEVVSEITAPFTGIFSAYSLYNLVDQ